ncbi:MAG: EAL domain-containing protein [Caulobacteraceae bacterium]|nr:EAL domain-containing protein [Caulobacteraceae bacterium]
MEQRAKLKDQVWVVAAAGVVAIALLAVTLQWMAADFDRGATAHEQSVVENGMAARIDEIGRQVAPQVAWDDAVLNLDNRMNLAWARDNIGAYLHVTGGFEFAWVLDGEDRPAYGMNAGEDVPAADYARISGAAALVVEAVRRAEAERGQTGIWDSPRPLIAANAIEIIGADLFIVSASLVQPDFGTARIKGLRAPVVVTGRRVDQALVSTFSDRYMLREAHLHLLNTQFEPGRAHVVIANSAGRAVATLDWNPPQPGARLLGKVLPIILALLVVMLAVALLGYRRAHAAARAVLASEQRAIHIAHHDGLTGLGNRHALEERLEALVTAYRAGGARYALHCVDLDNFKEINDISGPSVGDELLRTAARRLQRLAGGQGLCFRLDGDEFAVLQRITEDGEARPLAERILETLAKRFALTIGRFQLTASLGVGLMEPADEAAGDVLRKAGLALVSAKREGRARALVFDPGMDECMRRRRGLQDALRRDLYAEALTMVYQPQVDRDLNLIGVEALVRWTSDEFGPVSPSVFVPLAEESGMIEALGAFTLKRAFEDSLRWPGLKMAVNVSALQLRDPSFTDRIVALAKDTGVEPSGVELELTEGILIDGGDGSARRLEALKDAGFCLAIDDFSTGYSSLSYLSRFPIGKIKIDRSFVIDMGHSSSADVLVSTIVQLGRSLKMRVIAEGVETPEQWLRLAAAGCNEFQGYLASRPVPAEAIDRLYAGERVDGAGVDPRYSPAWRKTAA